MGSVPSYTGLGLPFVAPPPPAPFPRWTVAVDGLGKIRSARVRTAPLTLLVGENNTGKSYLATLLWSLHRYLHEVIPGDSADTAAGRICADWVRGFLSQTPRGGHAKLAPPDTDAFFVHLNELLQKRSRELLARGFNREEIQVEHLSLEAVETSPIDIEYKEFDGSPEESPGLLDIGPGFLSIVDNRRAAAVAPAEDDQLVNSFIGLLTARLVLPDDRRAALYLPASRTGFMLLYPDVVKSDISRRKIRGNTRREAPAELTAPMIEFLEFIAAGIRPGEKGPHSDLADALEAHLRGTLEIGADLGARRYAFRPEGGAPLPMALSSSLVTELAPIIAVLRHTDPGFLVVEEPEAHLHPELQCVMARLLVRLVRRGVQVCVTTHSENFCQQINNLLKVGLLRDRGADVSAIKLGDDEYLQADDVAAYEFRREPAGTEVVALETTAEGIAMPLFNRALADLTGQTIDLQRAIDAVTTGEPRA